MTDRPFVLDDVLLLALAHLEKNDGACGEIAFSVIEAAQFHASRFLKMPQQQQKQKQQLQQQKKGKKGAKNSNKSVILDQEQESDSDAEKEDAAKVSAANGAISSRSNPIDLLGAIVDINISTSRKICAAKLPDGANDDDEEGNAEEDEAATLASMTQKEQEQELIDPVVVFHRCAHATVDGAISAYGVFAQLDKTPHLITLQSDFARRVMFVLSNSLSIATLFAALMTPEVLNANVSSQVVSALLQEQQQSQQQESQQQQKSSPVKTAKKAATTATPNTNNDNVFFDQVMQLFRRVGASAEQCQRCLQAVLELATATGSLGCVPPELVNAAAASQQTQQQQQTQESESQQLQRSNSKSEAAALATAIRSLVEAFRQLALEHMRLALKMMRVLQIDGVYGPRASAGHAAVDNVVQGSSSSSKTNNSSKDGNKDTKQGKKAAEEEAARFKTQLSERQGIEAKHLVFVSRFLGDISLVDESVKSLATGAAVPEAAVTATDRRRSRSASQSAPPTPQNTAAAAPQQQQSQPQQKQQQQPAPPPPQPPAIPPRVIQHAPHNTSTGSVDSHIIRQGQMDPSVLELDTTPNVSGILSTEQQQQQQPPSSGTVIVRTWGLRKTVPGSFLLLDQKVVRT